MNAQLEALIREAIYAILNKIQKTLDVGRIKKDGA